MSKDARDNQLALPRLYVKPKDGGPVPKEWLKKPPFRCSQRHSEIRARAKTKHPQKAQKS